MRECWVRVQGLRFTVKDVLTTAEVSRSVW